MKRMKERDYFEMLRHVPQHSDESRFARDYRANFVAGDAKTSPLMQILSDAAEVIGMTAFFGFIVFVWAVLA